MFRQTVAAVAAVAALAVAGTALAQERVNLKILTPSQGVISRAVLGALAASLSKHIPGYTAAAGLAMRDTGTFRWVRDTIPSKDLKAIFRRSAPCPVTATMVASPRFGFLASLY